MYDYFFELPYAIFGFPALLLLCILIISFFLGGIDFDGVDVDIDVESDGITAGGFNALLVSAGISRVPLIIGMTATLWVAHFISSMTYDHILVNLIPSSIVNYVHYLLVIPYFIGSLYIAAIPLRPFEKMATTNAEIVVESIIGKVGYANSTITKDFGKGTVNVRNGSTTFMAYPKDEIEIPMSESIQVLGEHSRDENGNIIYLVTLHTD